MDLLLDPRAQAGERGELQLAHACHRLARELDLAACHAHDGVRAGGDGRRNGKVVAQARPLELEEALRFVDVLQAVLSGVFERQPVEVAANEGSRRLGDEDLSAAGERADSRGTDDVDAEIPLVAERGLPGVDTHAYQHP